MRQIIDQRSRPDVTIPQKLEFKLLIEIYDERTRIIPIRKT